MFSCSTLAKVLQSYSYFTLAFLVWLLCSWSGCFAPRSTRLVGPLFVLVVSCTSSFMFGLALLCFVVALFWSALWRATMPGVQRPRYAKQRQAGPPTPLWNAATSSLLPVDVETAPFLRRPRIHIGRTVNIKRLPRTTLRRRWRRGDVIQVGVTPCPGCLLCGHSKPALSLPAGTGAGGKAAPCRHDCIP